MNRWKLTLAAAVLALNVSSVQATIVERMNLRKLSIRADLVVVGTVQAVAEKAVVDGSAAYRFVTLTDLDVVAGTFTGTSLTLRMLGGSLPDESILYVPGMPVFEAGKRYVLFVHCGNGALACPLRGWTQGQIKVLEPRDGDASRLASAQGRALLGIYRGHLVKAPRQPTKTAGPEPDVQFIDLDLDRVGPDQERNLATRFAGRRLTLHELCTAIRTFRAHARVAPDPERVVRSADPAALPATVEGRFEPPPPVVGRKSK